MLLLNSYNLYSLRLCDKTKSGNLGFQKTLFWLTSDGSYVLNSTYIVQTSFPKVDTATYGDFPSEKYDLNPLRTIVSPIAFIADQLRDLVTYPCVDSEWLNDTAVVTGVKEITDGLFKGGKIVEFTAFNLDLNAKTTVTAENYGAEFIDPYPILNPVDAEVVDEFDIDAKTFMDLLKDMIQLSDTVSVKVIRKESGERRLHLTSKRTGMIDGKSETIQEKQAIFALFRKDERPENAETDKMSGNHDDIKVEVSCGGATTGEMTLGQFKRVVDKITKNSTPPSQEIV